MSPFHLAQVNVARARAPLDDPLLADFVGNLDRINALAEDTPGFVWRLKDESGNATDIAVGDDPRVIINLSVWRSVEQLFEFVYRTGHSKIMTRRREWFERWDGPHMALWWVPAGHTSSVAEALDRLALLAERGPTAEVFTFKTRFPAPDSMLAEETIAANWDVTRPPTVAPPLQPSPVKGEGARARLPYSSSPPVGGRPRGSEVACRRNPE